MFKSFIIQWLAVNLHYHNIILCILSYIQYIIWLAYHLACNSLIISWLAFYLVSNIL